MMESIQLSAEPAGAIEDPVLDELSDEAEAEEALFAPMGGEEVSRRIEDPDRTYDLVLAPPAVVDLRRMLGQQAGHSVLSFAEAFVGQPVPILVCHAITPFSVPGERLAPIWRMDYQAELVGVEQARTVSVVPASEVVTKASVSVGTGMSLAAGAKLASPLGALAAMFPLPDAHLEASADGEVRLKLPDFKIEAVKVIAGPYGAGGAKWELYRRRDVLNVSQALLHVVALPAGVDQLTLRLQAWVCRRGWFGMKRENRVWRTPVRHVVVSLAALDHA